MTTTFQSILAAAAVTLLAHGDVPASDDGQVAWGRPAFLGATAIDWAQTHDIRRQPGRFHELQPALGHHPDAGDINRYFVVSTAALYGLCEWGPERLVRDREACFRGLAAGRAFVVLRNHYLGIGVRF